MDRLRALALGLAGFALVAAKPAAIVMDKDNPSCPAAPDWGQAKAIALTAEDRGGKHVLIADGIIDSTLPKRLKAALDADERIEEIWIKSRGGDARAGNLAG
ncbi:MAG: hypothetical protein K2Q27_05235, partial [Novosphingobium sp.]|nr:hypothetical protein [Novosphingobium sp.]